MLAQFFLGLYKTLRLIFLSNYFGFLLLLFNVLEWEFMSFALLTRLFKDEEILSGVLFIEHVLVIILSLLIISKVSWGHWSSGHWTSGYGTLILSWWSYGGTVASRALHAQRVRIILKIGRFRKIEARTNQLWTCFELLYKDFAHAWTSRS